MTENAINGWALSLLELANDWTEAQWLVDKVRSGGQRRPAPIEMRRLFCQKFTPADGLEDDKVDISDVYSVLKG